MVLCNSGSKEASVKCYKSSVWVKDKNIGIAGDDADG